MANRIVLNSITVYSECEQYEKMVTTKSPHFICLSFGMKREKVVRD